MAEYKNKELDKVPKELFRPSNKEVETVKRVHQRFLDMEQERDKARHEFDGLTLREYVNASMDAWNGIPSDEIKASKEDWQSLSWDHKTRGKIKTLISMIVNARPFISLVGKSRESNKYVSEMLDTYEDTWKQEKGSYKLFLQATSAACKGTVIVEEMYVEEKVKRKEIKKINQETGQITFTEKEVIRGGVGRVECQIFPLLQFYPNENSAEIKHDCCTLKQFTKKAFMNKYGKYTNAEFVKKGNLYFDFDEGSYKEQKTPQSQITVLNYYNEDWDEHIILANNIWINKQEKDESAPIPFDHHRLPFAKTVAELADEECFYGKSWPDLMKGEQDPTNALTRLMIDREILSLNRGFILGSGVEIDSYELYPGSIKHVTGMPGVPLNQQMMEQNISGASQSGFQLLQLLRTSADINTSIDPTAQGVHSGRKTARESVILDENAKRNSGTFQLNVYKLLWDRAELRVENIKQFYTSPVQISVLKDKYGKDKVDDNGKKTEIGKVYREIPVEKSGQETRWFNVSPKMKGCEFDIRFVEDYEMPDNRSARIELSKALLDESKANPLINCDEAVINYLESIRMNPERFYIKPTEEALDFQNSQGVPPQNEVPNNPNI